jgi:hypothetical protein
VGLLTRRLSIVPNTLRARNPGMELHSVGATLDSNEPELLADFWQEAIGFRTRMGDGDPSITLSDAPVGAGAAHRRTQAMVSPPDTDRVWPVMNPAASEAR